MSERLPPEREQRAGGVEVGDVGSDGGEDIGLYIFEGDEDDLVTLQGVALLLDHDVEHHVVWFGGSDEARQVTEAHCSLFF